MPVYNTTIQPYTVSGQYHNNETFTVHGATTIRGHLSGDANGDNVVDISDAVYLIQYIFGGGPAPDPIYAGDANGDREVDISDCVYLIQYIFGGGPAPVPNC
jgi:hypothetical protein